MAPAMTGWFTQNTDYVLFFVLVTGLWLGLGLWLHRTGRLASLPKVTWGLLALVAGGGWWAVDRAGHDAQNNIRRQVGLVVPVYVRELQQAGHARLPDNPAPGDKLYEQLIQMQINWLKLNPAIADIYTFRRRADGAIFLLVDSETDFDHNGRIEGAKEARTTPGELYDGVTPALNRAFRGEAVFDEDIVEDRWGRWVSAFAPLRNSAGAVEAVLGVDFDAAQWLEQRARARLATLGLLGGVVLLLTGPVVLITVLRHDLRRRREVERQLREQAGLRRLIFDQAPGGVALANLDCRLIEVNESFCRMLGYRREELLEMTFLQITHPDDIDITRDNNQLAAGGGDVPPLEKRYICKDGSIVHVQVRVGLVRDANGAPQYLVGQITDITDRREAEAKLRNRQQQLTTILGHAPLVLYAVDARGIITLAEGAGTAAIGRQPGEAVGYSVFDRYAARPDILGDVRRALAGETVTNQHEISGVTFEARTLPVREPDGSISGLIGVAINITDRAAVAREKEKIEQKLREVQQLASLGVLAGGVAHDFNNLLTTILGNASLARLGLPPASPVAGHIDQIEQTARRAADLCQQLLAAGGRRESPPVAAPAPVPARNWRGSGTVLIVDDEQAVRATAAQMIAFFGFTVKQAESGQQALDFVRQRGSRFDLVLLDLTMPGMDGYATFTALRQLQPDQRIVVFSGYSAQDARRRFAGQNLNGFLQKPFGPDSLCAVLREATLN